MTATQPTPSALHTRHLLHRTRLPSRVPGVGTPTMGM